MPSWDYVAEVIKRELKSQGKPACNCEKCMPWLHRSHTIKPKEGVVTPNFPNRTFGKFKTRRFPDHE